MQVPSIQSLNYILIVNVCGFSWKMQFQNAIHCIETIIATLNVTLNRFAIHASIQMTCRLQTQRYVSISYRFILLEFKQKTNNLKRDPFVNIERVKLL